MFSSREAFENDFCPVRDELLGEMYRANEHGLAKLVESVSADVRAIEDSEALIMTPAGFDRLRLANSRLAVRFVMDLGRILSVRFREYNTRLAALAKL